MRPLVGSSLAPTIIFGIIGLACKLTAVSADIASGIRRLCADREFDAAAVLDRPNGRALFVFKGRDLWVTDFDNLISEILKPVGPRNVVFSEENVIEAQQVFANFSDGPKRVVSFTGLNASHPLQNNILVFNEERQMTRYKVVHIDLNLMENSTTQSVWSGRGNRLAREELVAARAGAQRNRKANITTTLESQHTTVHWPFFPPTLADFKLLFNVPNTRLLSSIASIMVHTREGERKVLAHALWVLNRKNLDKPAGLLTGHNLKVYAPYPFSSKSFVFHHRWVVVNNRTGLGLKYHFSIIRDGLLCFELTCAPLIDFLDCDAHIRHFTGGLAYWIQYETEMTFRLLMSALVSALLISLSISMTFIYNQLKKVVELT